jgi:DNA-binding GntR family transcriptional regulator
MMSVADAITQDRVYRALKTEYLAGEYALGARLELQAVADRLRASKTPVREAVHRLMGEQLLEGDPGGGFRICAPTPASLIQLYAWNEHLLIGLCRLLKPSQLTQRLDRLAGLPPPDEPLQIAGRIGAIFLSFAEASGNAEAMLAIGHINERLLYMRVAEVTDVPQSQKELRTMTNGAIADVQKSVRRRLAAYHQRRIDRLHRFEAGARSGQ